MARARSTGSESGPLEIGPLTAHDLAEVLEIERASFIDPWPEGAFRSDLDNPGLAYVRAARMGGRLAGYLIAWRVADELHLTNLAVAEEFRRHRLAWRLLDDLAAEAGRAGCRVITLEVRRSNVGAIALYERYGFRRIGVRRRYYEVGNEDALVLALMTGRTGEDA